MPHTRRSSFPSVLVIAAALSICCSEDSAVTPDAGGPGADGPGSGYSPRRFGFLSAYGQRPVNQEWKKVGKDLVHFSSGLVKEVGAGWARELTFIYPGATTLDPITEAALKQAETDGQTVLAVVAVDQSSFPSKKTESMAWLDKLIRGLSSRVKYWQVHNEVGKKDRYEKSADYLELLKAASGTIRKACGECKVVMASTIPDEAYFAALVDGGDSHVDAYDAHMFDEKHFSVLKSFITKVRSRSQTKPFFMTEVATYSGQPAFGKFQAQTERQQAETLIKWFAKSFGLGASHVFWSQLVEWYKFMGKEDGFFDLTGLVYNGLGKATPGEVAGKKKLAFQSLKVLVAKVDRFSKAELLGEGQVRFTVGGKQVHVLWCAGACAVPAGLTGSRTVTDYQGKAATMEMSKVKLTSSPIFVE